MTSKQALFIDWLTLYGIACQPIDLTKFSSYRRRGDIKQSMYFKQVECVETYIDGRWQDLGVLCQIPTTPKMCGATISFKVANHILYRPDYYDIIIQTLMDFLIKDIHIARIDVAADFLRTVDGMSGQTLATRLAAYSFVRRGSRKLAVHGRCPYHIRQDGSIEARRGGIESVTFGTHASVCQFQIYNKTEELRQSSMGGYCPKEYIRECWRQAGVYSPDEDTWRVELRLNSKAHSLLNKVTGELVPVDLASLAPDRLAATITSIFMKWADIRRAPFDNSEIHHYDRLHRVHIIPDNPALSVVPKVKPQRNGLPASAYVKGVMTTIERLKENYVHLMNDPIDEYILGDALKAIKCIYHESRKEERVREAQQAYYEAIDKAATTWQEDHTAYYRDIYWRYLASIAKYNNLTY